MFGTDASWQKRGRVHHFARRHPAVRASASLQIHRAPFAVAESIVRASTMGAVEGADESTTMANLCPTTGADHAQAQAPSEAVAALAANALCKWRPIPIEDLAAMGDMGHQTLVRIGETLHQLRQAPWSIRAQTR